MPRKVGKITQYKLQLPLYIFIDITIYSFSVNKLQRLVSVPKKVLNDILYLVLSCTPTQKPIYMFKAKSTDQHAITGKKYIGEREEIKQPST